MIHRRTLLVTAMLAAVLGAAAPADAQTPAAAPSTILWLSDIHLDPFAVHDLKVLANANQSEWLDHTQWDGAMAPKTGPLSGSGQDTNAQLLYEVLHHALKIVPHPDAIVITGDFLSHHFPSNYFTATTANAALSKLNTQSQYKSFIDQTFAYVALSVSSRFPNVPIIATLGNNDAYCGDYHILEGSGFLTATEATVRQYFLPKLPQAFESDGGFYAYDLPGGQHVIVLNSIPFMGSYPAHLYSHGNQEVIDLRSECATKTTIGIEDAKTFLVNAVQALPPGDKAWIVCHVPPGISGFEGTSNWNKPTKAYTSTTASAPEVPFVDWFSDFYLAHADRLAGVLSGHSHEAEFKLILEDPTSEQSKAASFVLMAPSISRNHGNNASFRVMTYEPTTLRILDYTTYWLDSHAGDRSWGEPFRFADDYAQSEVTASSLQAVFKGIEGNLPAPNPDHAHGVYTLSDQYCWDYATRHGKTPTVVHYLESSVGSILPRPDRY